MKSFIACCFNCRVFKIVICFIGQGRSIVDQAIRELLVKEWSINTIWQILQNQIGQSVKTIPTGRIDKFGKIV